MQDYLKHYQLYDFRARCVIVSTTEILREMKKRHGLDPLTTIAVGRAISCAAMLASTLKSKNEYISCSFSGEGILRKVYADCNGAGDCRGYSKPGSIAEELANEEMMPEKVSHALGETGTVTVVRGVRGSKDSPYTAISEFMNGEIAADIARHLADSEQIPSAVAAGVKLSPEGEVISSGGVLIQKIAGTDLEDNLLTNLEIKMSEGLNLSDRLAAGVTHEEILKLIVGQAENFSLLLERPLQFKCTCSRDRMSLALIMLGAEEIQQIHDEFGKIETRCPYCARTEHFTPQELAVQ